MDLIFDILCEFKIFTPNIGPALGKIEDRVHRFFKLPLAYDESCELHH